jgi:hypothetical protein
MATFLNDVARLIAAERRDIYSDALPPHLSAEKEIGRSVFYKH